MPFQLPSGLQLAGQTTANSDNEVGTVESAQPLGTRILVTLKFPQGTPGVGVLAGTADLAARAIAGLTPWPEYSRVVTADPDYPWWHVTYVRSAVASSGVGPALAPIWWLLIIAAIAAVVLFPDIIARIISIVSAAGGEFFAGFASLIQMIVLVIPVMLISRLFESPKELSP